MQALLPIAHRLGATLKEHRETIVVVEGSAGGLISAALLAVPGASSYYLGGAVVYTRVARRVLLGLGDDAFGSIRPSTETYSLALARAAREQFDATWAIAKSGAAGPTGNRWGCRGPRRASRHRAARGGSYTRTGSADREGNMRAFAAAAMELMERVLGGSRTPGDRRTPTSAPLADIDIHLFRRSAESRARLLNRAGSLERREASPRCRIRSRATPSLGPISDERLGRFPHRADDAQTTWFSRLDDDGAVEGYGWRWHGAPAWQQGLSELLRRRSRRRRLLRWSVRRPARLSRSRRDQPLSCPWPYR